MHVVADTDTLVADGTITSAAARVIEARARQLMVSLGINTLLCAGIVAATLGLIFWLADPGSVAFSGIALLAVGLGVLSRGDKVYAMFGNAAALIGAGMLMGGAGIELARNHADIAGPAMTLLGLLPAGLAGRALIRGGVAARFVTGSIGLMGLALHLAGLLFWLRHTQTTGLPVAAFCLYATATISGAGWLTNVRLVTALAIVPFAQALDTGTYYFHAAYVFYSPESTLSILQMGVLGTALILLAARSTERIARHARILTIMAFVVANLCALVGSLWGDVVGLTLWGPGYRRWGRGISWEEYQAARDAFEATTLVISRDAYTILWAVSLIVLAAWAAHRTNRGLFNAAITFGALHAYTQMFESFRDEPLAYVIGGFAAIPLAWGMWRLNQRFLARHGEAAEAV